MRLFFAILLPEPLKDALSDAIVLLRQASAKGRFTRRDNLHLTLAFLGEVAPERLDALSEVMGSFSVRPFTLRFHRFDRFHQNGRDIWWVGAEHNETLQTAYRELAVSLKRYGFPFEDQPYVPHLTLGREIITAPGFDREAIEMTLPVMEMRVTRLSLMQSSQVNGSLTYVELRQHLLVETRATDA